MAIALDSSVVNPVINPQARITSAARADQATGAFEIDGQRISQQVSATNVQLSASAQIKSSYYDIQSAAKSLSAPGKSTTAEDTTKAVQDFAEAFNKATLAINSALRGDGRAASVLAGEGRAGLVGYDLKKIIPNGENTADLKKIGISARQDGTMFVDKQALQKAIRENPEAVRQTLARVGAQAEQITDQALAGNDDTRSDRLSTYAKMLAR